jgi:Amt family ammonium transporter
MNIEMGKKIYFFVLLVIVIICVYSASNYQELTSAIDSGDTAWMIVASAFVLLMTPGLSFFYGGMVSKKNIISTMLQSFIALGVVSILWVLIGFSLAFGDSIGGIIGNPLTYFAFNNVGFRTKPRFYFNNTVFTFCLISIKICNYNTRINYW